MHGVGVVSPLAGIQLILRDSSVIQLYFCNQDLSVVCWLLRWRSLSTDLFANAFLCPIFILGSSMWDCIAQYSFNITTEIHRCWSACMGFKKILLRCQAAAKSIATIYIYNIIIIMDWVIYPIMSCGVLSWFHVNSLASLHLMRQRKEITQ